MAVNSKNSNRSKGKQAEEVAASYLESKGYTILDRNYYFQHAEVDIVALGDDYIVFVEVKSRKNNHFGRPEEALDYVKQNNVIKAAEAWLHERKMTGAFIRFDVIAITQEDSNKTPDIRHFDNAFQPPV